MSYQLTTLDQNSKVIIRTSDTDTLVIALGCYAKNSLTYIDVWKLFNKLGKDLCRALPALHVFTSSDYTALHVFTDTDYTALHVFTGTYYTALHVFTGWH